MPLHTTLARYSHIIRLLRRQPSAFSAIKEYLHEQSLLDGCTYTTSERTFLRDRAAIQSLYGIEISFDFVQQAYSIADTDDYADLNGAGLRLMESFEVLHALRQSEDFAGLVIFDVRRPQHTPHFPLLVQAIRQQKKVRFAYKKFGEEVAASRTAGPLALKEFKGRWYLIAEDAAPKEIRTFGLDRIHNPEILPGKYLAPAGFHPGIYFRYAFGIIALPGLPAEPVILAFDGDQAQYVLSHPLHFSQRLLNSSNEGIVISLMVHPTYDLLLEILSHGATVSVLSPASLRAQVASAATSILEDNVVEALKA